MKGHIRRRTKGSWEYIIDVGIHPAQRCSVCCRRFWIERRPRAECPKCGGRLTETEERRRQTKAGFATRREAQAAMNKTLVAVEEHTYVAPTRLTVREYLTREWLPAIESTIRPSTFRSYKQHVECHICPHIGALQMQKLSGAQINALYAKLAVSGKRDAKTGLSALSIRHTHATLHRALKDAVRWERTSRNPADAADPPRVSGAGSHEMKFHRARIRASRPPCRNLGKGLLSGQYPMPSAISRLDAKQAPNARLAGKSAGNGAGNGT